MYFSFSQETNQFCGWTEMQFFTFMKILIFFQYKISVLFRAKFCLWCNRMRCMHTQLHNQVILILFTC